MKRRAFIASLTGGLLAVPLAAEGQQAGKVWRIGVFLTSDGPNVEAFRQELRKLGYVEGHNILIEYRWHEGKVDRLPALAAELVNLRLDLILVSGSQPTLALKAATTTVPIVFAGNADPVGLGLVSSLAHPGGNLTGLAILVPEEFGAKQVQLLKEAVPAAARMAVLIHRENPMHRAYLPQTVAAAKKLNIRLQILEARTPSELDSAFAAATRERADAMQVYADLLFNTHRTRILALAAKSRLPVLYLFKEDVVAGGLMSYGPDRSDMFPRAATYVDKILRGTLPGDIPVEQPNKFELVINLKTAKALGLTIPPSLLGRADEVIQ
jgi:putative ABC transport system substrate-binding protein